MKARLKKVIIFAIALSLFPSLEISSFETLFPEPEESCPYHSCGVGAGSVYEWQEDKYETDENLIDENVGFKTFSVGGWVHKKYWDGRWECVPFEKSWLYDYYNTFGWPNEEPLTFQEELRSGPVRWSDRETPIFLKFGFPVHVTRFRTLYNAAKKNLGFLYSFGNKQEYDSSDYTMVLKYILEQVAKERVLERNLTKLFNPDKINTMTTLIDLNNLRTPIYFYNEVTMKQFETLYDNLKVYSNFVEEEKFQGGYFAETLYFIACKLFRPRAPYPKELSRELFQDIFKLIPEECWRTINTS